MNTPIELHAAAVIRDKRRASFFKYAASYFRRILDDLLAVIYYFHKEKFFKYLMIIVVLMLCLAAMFTYFEYGNVIQATPNAENASVLDIAMTSIYYSIVTVATVGYGDISPKSTGGRFIVTIAIYMSLAAVALFSANLTSTMTTMRIKEGRGFMHFANMKNHMIICGWKKEMERVLEEILISNPTLSKENIVVIANIESDAIELFRQQFPHLVDVKILRGEYNNENILKNANIKDAFKVFILADESSPASNMERDSRTIMTALTVNTISGDANICAELLDRKFESYLRNIHVDEIIYSSDYGRALIANSVKGIGVAKVINDLLDVKKDVNIVTHSIPDDFVGKMYRDLSLYFHDLDKSLLIGLLENVGGYLERKREALREAQKTPDISKIVHNLQVTKTIENYKPNLNPGDDYIIQKNTFAVLIQRKPSPIN